VLYLTALGKEATDWKAAEQPHVQATAIDPTFALAYARASILNSWFFPERYAKARAQAEEALRLSPKLGEGHVALGLCLYLGERKYDAALKEFEIAAATSPNNAHIYKYVGGIYRRQGRWRDAVASFDRAISLDPLNPAITQLAANNHIYLRDWAAAAAGYTRTLEIEPESMVSRSALAYLEVFRNGNPTAGAKLLQNVPAGRDPYNFVALTRWDLAMLERDYATAERLSSDLPELPAGHMDSPKTFYQARTALARGDMEAARRYFAATTPVLEARVRDHPDDANSHSWLGILYGYMRRKEDAIRESRRAVELEPESRDAFHGALYSASLALVYALVGEEDEAMTLIERLLSTPGAVSYPDSPQNMTLADLRLRWEWDSLRSNPRFQRILAAPEPKNSFLGQPLGRTSC
jgi:tetratricopeptide (TPR) repeat protein